MRPNVVRCSPEERTEHLHCQIASIRADCQPLAADSATPGPESAASGPEFGWRSRARFLTGASERVAGLRGAGAALVTDRLPIGVSIRTIRAEPRWWLESAKRLDAAGYQGIWAWDHFMGRGDVTVPVVEGPTILAMAAGATSQVTIGTFVINAMNRHPAVLARMASTLQIASGGRFILGLGTGGHPAEHEAYGMEFPNAKERAAR